MVQLYYFAGKYQVFSAQFVEKTVLSPLNVLALLSKII